jgi:ABC-type dipeptide/oligopeptide/nickel transport system ATPase component
MGKYKINSISDNGVFVVTESYKKLFNSFKSLKKSRGRIIHVVGAPGTGKSANIYSALDELGLNIYDVELRIKDIDMDSEDVFKGIYLEMKRDLEAGSKEEVYDGLSKFDAVLFADRFHDSHLLDNSTVGFSVWTDQAGFKAIKFYLLCIFEYFKERKSFKEINMILQTAWRIHIKGKKYDVFSDLGILSRVILALMRIFFEVVEISYSPQETLKIVKEHVDVDEKLVEHYIDKYGSKPRFICQAIENDK